MTDLTYLSEYVLNEIYNTPEYKEYEAELSLLKADPTLYERVTEFREKNFLLQQSDAEDMLDHMDALTNEYEDVINIELVNDFMEAEVALCKMIQNFNRNMIDGLKFE